MDPEARDGDTRERRNRLIVQATGSIFGYRNGTTGYESAEELCCLLPQPPLAKHRLSVATNTSLPFGCRSR